jgi:predicted tellurium resistance membrane protein TerC
MSDISVLLTDPTAWAALVTLVVLEVVLGIDNLVFISILTNRLPEERRGQARTIGIALALGLRLLLLGTISWIVGLKATVFEIPFTPPVNAEGHVIFDLAFSWRDLILITGGLFLVWKATTEIHHNMSPGHDALATPADRPGRTFGATIIQILLLDLVFSIDSILTAVGMTNEIPIMFAAVIIAVTVMLLASGPLARFIHSHPTVVMLALGFLLMIGTVLIAEGFGAHIPKGYIYTAMAFSAFIEALNMRVRSRTPQSGATSGT